METTRSSRTFCLRRTHESGFERGLFTFHVSPFHRRPSRIFFGRLWGVVCIVWFLLVSHDFEIAPVLAMLCIERPSGLSWLARHGGKKSCNTPAVIVASHITFFLHLGFELRSSCWVSPGFHCGLCFAGTGSSGPFARYSCLIVSLCLSFVRIHDLVCRQASCFRATECT